MLYWTGLGQKAEPLKMVIIFFFFCQNCNLLDFLAPGEQGMETFMLTYNTYNLSTPAAEEFNIITYL